MCLQYLGFSAAVNRASSQSYLAAGLKGFLCQSGCGDTSLIVRSRDWGNEWRLQADDLPWLYGYLALGSPDHNILIEQVCSTPKRTPFPIY